MPAVMIQGTGSNVGKSLLVAGLCRAALRRGISVAPFKPQNMSNNAAVTADGGEIGRAQALQAIASGLEPMTDMNPVLLKPESETGAQVVVHGRRVSNVRAADYGQVKAGLLEAVMQSYRRLSARHDLVIVEGAGSPAEINLRANDIANMGFARKAGVPVVLAGDIDRGGVIAQIVGTQSVIDPEDAAMVRGFLINKFRGDPALFEDGYRAIEARTGWRGYGVLPYFNDAARLPAEDAVDLAEGFGQGETLIACLQLLRIANFDDLDPLKQEPGLRVVMVRPGQAIPGNCALVILPGTKSTRADMEFLRQQGWDIDLAAHVRRGGRVLGICGGYQMLGQVIRDPEGIEGPAGETQGLGLLRTETVMTGEKRLTRVSAVYEVSGAEMRGYEIHIGRTDGADCVRPFARIEGRPEGARSADGRIMGSYLHGMFAGDAFRAAFLAGLNVTAGGIAHDTVIEATLDALADHMEAHLDVEGLLALGSGARA